MNEQINSYVKEGLSKGYTEQQLRKILFDNNVSAQDIDEAFDVVHGALPAQAQQQMPEQKHNYDRLYSWLLIIGGLIIMIGIYLYKIFQMQVAEAEDEASPAMTLIKGLWPLIVPIGANIANFKMFRKRFVIGLIFTIVIIAALVGFIYLMDKVATAALS
ncbi:MAG: hypothetical protein V1906_00745 [Candidatus Woesearchaeota archaeon]